MIQSRTRLGLPLLVVGIVVVAGSVPVLAQQKAPTSQTVTLNPGDSIRVRCATQLSGTWGANALNSTCATAAPVVSTATPTMQPSATPTLTPMPTATAAPSCPPTLQSLVDAAAPGATLAVPPCVFRETVVITKPLTLDGQGKAEIRGSDVVTNWTPLGGVWLSPAPSLPVYQDTSRCGDPSNRCLVPQQVYLDGTALRWVASSPASGQFTVSGGQFQIADNPAGHTLEVTTRQAWIVTQADNVAIENMTFTAAGNDAQTGAVANGGHTNWTLKGSTLSHAHGALVSLDRGTGARILNNELSFAGEEAVHGYANTGTLIYGNQIHDNSIDGFNGGWEAGGIKIASDASLTVDSNELWNTGPGVAVWCDIGCTTATITNNRVHDNAGAGIEFEVSDGAKVTSNALWHNGDPACVWAWCGTVLLNSSARAEVANNTLAWSTGGIDVVSQNRADQPASGVVGNYVHDNKIIASDVGNWHGIALGWFQDWSGVLYQSASNNRGANNGYWYPVPENDQWRYVWTTGYPTLSAFDATPAERGGYYLSDAQKATALSSAGIPSR